MNTCAHISVRCLNEFELIRKYRCEDCGAVMMCACDESIGRKFLARQLDHGSELETRQRVPVTAGFQTAVCRECRKLPIIAHPVAEIHGRTSKIRRYYWRELAFSKMERFAAWAESQDAATMTPDLEKDARERIEKEVLQELKTLHETSPKYVYTAESEAETIKNFQVEVVPLKGVYVTNPQRKGVAVLDNAEPCDVEEFAARHFRRLGFATLFTESVPFHVLFGVFMWLVMQDPADPQFLEESVRSLVERNVLGGTPGYYSLLDPLQELRIPPTVQAILAARIDRLPDRAKRVLQTAAVVGKDVPYAILKIHRRYRRR